MYICVKFFFANYHLLLDFPILYETLAPWF